MGRGVRSSYGLRRRDGAHKKGRRKPRVGVVGIEKEPKWSGARD